MGCIQDIAVSGEEKRVGDNSFRLVRDQVEAYPLQSSGEL